MAVLEKIRNRTVFLIVIIGLALFAFVISDFIGSGRFSNSQPTEIGTVNGEDVSIDAFRFQVENALQGANGQVSSIEAAKYVWEQNVRNIILKQQFEKLGLSIEKDQILSVLAKSPLAQNPEFTNEFGVFDASKFVNYLATLKASNPVAYQQWKAQEDALVEGAKQQMYFSLIQAGLGVTNVEAEIAYHQEQDKADIRFVALPYSLIPDSTITVSESEIGAYIKKHQKQFKQEAFRNIQYVVVNEKASAEDIQASKDALSRLLQPEVVFNSKTGTNDTLQGFAKTNNVREFVDKHSDQPYDSLFVTKNELPVLYADTLFALPVGQVFGPYEESGSLKLTRMMGKQVNGAVKASHILIPFAGSMAGQNATRTKEEAKAKAEQLLTQARVANADFASLARENSEEPGAQYSGGDLGFFTRGRMVKPFEEFAFANPVGHIGVVETDFGFHVVKIVEKTDAVQLATINRKIEPSEATVNDLFAKVSKFEMDAIADVKNFGDVAKKSDLTVLRADNLKRNDEYIIGLGNNRQIVQWLFQEDAKVGDIRRFSSNGAYIVAQLTKKGEEGITSPQEATPFVKPILVRQKKATILAEKVKKGASLETVASDNKVEVKTATGLSMNNPTIIGEGREPRVVGTAFALKQGQISKPVEGENGVYVVEVMSTTQAPALTDYKSYQKSLEKLKIDRAAQEVYNALKNAAEIEENLSLFY